MPVAWEQLQVPGPPLAFALNAAERAGPTPLARFARRIVQLTDCGNGDQLALVDKASPHARFDLMLSEVSARDKATPDAVQATTGRLLWQTGLDFVRFVSEASTMRAFGLAGGRVHLALNCDPNTHDRESVQASKQFHLHLLYWHADELAALARPGRLDQIADARLRRQGLDPLAFLGPRLIREGLAGLDLSLAPGGAPARWLPNDDAAVCVGERPLGALLAVPGWAVLGTPGFAALIGRLHRGLARLATDLLWAFTDQRAAPAPWQRHPRLPLTAIAARLVQQGWSARTRADLLTLAAALRTLGPDSARRLRGAGAAARMHTLTLNPPCYALTLQAAAANTAQAPLLASDQVLMALQPKLFSGIGGAGLLSLAGPAGLVPSVRVVRGTGTYSSADWFERAAFQRAFALAGGATPPPSGVSRGAVRTLRDFTTGWR